MKRFWLLHTQRVPGGWFVCIQLPRGKCFGFYVRPPWAPSLLGKGKKFPAEPPSVWLDGERFSRKYDVWRK